MQMPAGMQVFERGWLSSNTVVFTGAVNAVVDTGYVTHAELGAQLVQRALGERTLNRIVNTHLHSDHCGGNARLQQAYPQARTFVPAPDAAAAMRWDEKHLSFAATGQQCARFRVDRAYGEGDELALGDHWFVARAAPGHDPRMFVLWCERERVLISADALWADGFGVIFPELEGEPGFADMAATLDMIAALAPRLVIPGHGAPFEDAGAALERARGRLAYLRADPQRNARHALKVLVKFLLLDRGRLALDALPALLGGLRYVRELNARFLQLNADALAHWVADGLVAAGAARIEDGVLVDC